MMCMDVYGYMSLGGDVHMNSCAHIAWSWCYRLRANRCGCWKLNSGPPEESYVLLTTKPSFYKMLWK